jgi:hypothetical protein
MDIGVNLPCSNKNSKPLVDDALDIIAHNYALGTLIPLDKDVVDNMICDDKSTRTKFIQTVSDIESSSMSKTTKRLKKTLARKECANFFLAKFIKDRVTNMRNISDELNQIGDKMELPSNLDAIEQFAYNYKVHVGARRFKTRCGYEYFIKTGLPPWNIEQNVMRKIS